MAVPTNTVQTFARTNIREDLGNIISNIAPTDTPFMSNIGTGKATARLHEWLTDNLASADPNNMTIEGDDVTNDTAPGSVRRNNYTQLSDKSIVVSSTSQAVDTAGYKNELSYQFAKKGKELKRDMEIRLSGNYAAAPGAAGTAGQTAGACAFIISNDSRGATGADPTLSGGTTGYPNAAATNGTLRTITEAMLKTVHQSAWLAGGEPNMLIVSGLIKQTCSTFAGIAQQRRETGNKAVTIIGAADVYVGDFGEVSFVPSRFTTGRDALLIDTSLWKLCDLQPYHTFDVAKTGHADKKALGREYTLQCTNEAGNAVIADVQP
jgi:Family of unknown function (DUF5309)